MSPRARSWPLLLDPENLAEALVLGLVNLPYLLGRAEPHGSSWDTLLAGLRLMVGSALLRLPPDVVGSLVTDPWEHCEGEGPSSETRAGFVDSLVVPLLRSLRDEFGDVCSTDCARVSTDPIILDAHLADSSYWDRYIVEVESAETDPRVLRIEQLDANCNVGFALDSTHSCPFLRENVELAEALDLYSRVIAMRVDARRDELGIPGLRD